jgi:hypothetical protein
MSTVLEGVVVVKENAASKDRLAELAAARAAAEKKDAKDERKDKAKQQQSEASAMSL